MKIVLVLALCVVGIYAEYCDHDDDCHITVCGANFKLDCYEHQGAHVCTCLPTTDTSFTCSSQVACSNKYGACTHGDHQWHCIDSKCRCSFFG